MFEDRFRPDPGPPVNGHPTPLLLGGPFAAHPAEIVIEPVGGDDVAPDIVQVWGEQSFPASDPPSNW